MTRRSRTTSTTIIALLVSTAAGCTGSSGPTAATNSASSVTLVGFDGFEAPPRPLEDYDRPLVRSTLRESALEVLEAAAFSESSLLRANAIESLQVVPNRVDAVARAGLTDTNPGVRFASLMTIGKLRLQSSRQFLRPLLSDTDPHVRMAAIYALTRFGETVDQTPLANNLLTGDSPVRAQAAYILGEIGNPSAVPMLRDTAAPPQRLEGSDGRPLEKPARRIDETLFRLQTAEALMKLGDDRVRHVIHSALYPAVRDDLEAAVLAAQILGELRDETAIRQLVELIEQPAADSPQTSDPRERVFLQPIELRLAAATAVANMGDAGGVYVADSALSSPDPAVRAQACFLYAAAAEVRDRGSAGQAALRLDLAKLETLLSDPNPLVQVAAAAGLLRALERG